MVRTLPLFVGTAIIASGAAAALTVSTQSVSFAVFMHTLIILGLLVSFAGNAAGKRPVVWGFVVIGTGLVVLVLRDQLGSWSDMLFPLDLQTLDEATVAALATWLLAGFCFMQGGRYGAVFVAATGMAILGLIGTVNVNSDFLVAFWVYTFGVIFTWGYEHLLRSSASARVQFANLGVLKQWLSWHLSASVLLLLIVLAVATVGGSFLYSVTPDFFERMSGQVRRLPATIQQMTFRCCAETDFRVGGGPINLPHTVAFSVKADHPALWRTQVYDLYQGTGWTKQVEAYYDMERLGPLRYAVSTSPKRGIINTQEFVFPRMLRGFLAAASGPVELQLTGDAEQAQRADVGDLSLLPAQVDAYGCIRANPAWLSRTFWGHDGELPLRHYNIVSRMPTDTPEALRGRGTDYPDGFEEYYVNQVPLAAKMHLSELVEETVAGIQDPYDRVKALRDMIVSRCFYTTNAPAVPLAKDAAAYFLLTSRRGACDLFATAMAVTARLAGVPARVAVGFQVGQYDARSRTFTVRQSDAHAWAEIYFLGVGWVPFEVQAPEVYESQTWMSLLSHGYTRLALAKLSRIALPLLMVPIAAYIALGGIYDLRRLLYRWRVPTHAGPASGLSRDYQRYCRQLAHRAGIRPNDAMTPREVVEAASANLVGPAVLKRRLMQLNEEFYNARFAAQSPDQRLRQVRTQITDMRRGMRGLKRKPQRPSPSGN